MIEEKEIINKADHKEIVLEEERYEDNDDLAEEEKPELQIAARDRKLVTHPYDFIIRSLSDQIDDNTLVLADKFQRRRVWDDTKASRLIESLLLNVPIPVCYFAELDDGSYSVIDGQQRLTAIYRFLKNEFALRGLRVRSEINKKRYNQLDVADKRLITSRTIRCIVILKESHPDIRFDVFEKLNTNSVRLNAQELRNSVYRGPLNDLLRELSEYKVFQKVRNVNDIDRRMHDCELILRFYAFHFRPDEYKGLLAPFLDNYLKDGKLFDHAKIAEHRKLFKRVIDDVNFVFGNRAFRRYRDDGERQEWEKLINRAIYDVIMLSFAQLESSRLRQEKENIIDALKKICRNERFDRAITSGTQAKDAVQIRLDEWRQALSAINLQIPHIKIGRDPGDTVG
ncbi:MAG: DUF262 domain-containing protein [Acidobacteriota bacterium]